MFPASARMVVVPLARSLGFAMFGYGIGTGPGDGVLHTSGMVAIETPVLALWQSVRLLMLTVTAIAFYSVLSPVSLRATGARAMRRRVRRFPSCTRGAHKGRSRIPSHLQWSQAPSSGAA